MTTTTSDVSARTTQRRSKQPFTAPDSEYITLSLTGVRSEFKARFAFAVRKGSNVNVLKLPPYLVCSETGHAVRKSAVFYQIVNQCDPAQYAACKQVIDRTMAVTQSYISAAGRVCHFSVNQFTYK